MIRGAALALTLAAACSGDALAPEPLGFSDATEDLGLSYVQSRLDPSGACLTSDETCEPELMAGGVAIGDVNGDGLPDVFVTRLGEHDLLFVNRGGRFEDETASWGLDGVAAQSNGAALFDADRDGDLDLYVTVLGRADDPAPNDRYYFYDNAGGRFVEQGEARGLAFADGAGHGGTSIAVGDYDRDGWPDLHLTEWRVSDSANVVAYSHERLLHNRGEAAPGHFEDVTEPAGVFLGDDNCRDNVRGCTAHSFTSTFTDLDDDGWPDLAVVADFGASRLFWNRGDGTFVEGTNAARVGTDDNGMGSAFGDYDEDGDLDWFVTSISTSHCEAECGWDSTGNRLYRNDGGRMFSDVTDEAGVRDGAWGWGAAFFDPDADGDLDLVMTSGFDQPRVPSDDEFGEGRMFLWQNEGAPAFRSVTDEVGLAREGAGRGLCVFDADGDGDLDVFVVEQGAGGRLYRNDAPPGNWLGVRALASDGRSTAYGARIRVRPSGDGSTQTREVGTGAHFLCAHEPVAHFGLGDEGAAEIEVRWPDGTTTRHEDVAAGQIVALTAP